MAGWKQQSRPVWNVGSPFAHCATLSAEYCVVSVFSVDDGSQCGNNVNLIFLHTSEAFLPQLNVIPCVIFLLTSHQCIFQSIVYNLPSHWIIHNKLDVVAHACNHSTWEAAEVGLLQEASLIYGMRSAWTIGWGHVSKTPPYSPPPLSLSYEVSLG